ncbi:unnamed protein product [Closterium sp. NIES-54]
MSPFVATNSGSYGSGKYSYVFMNLIYFELSNLLLTTSSALQPHSGAARGLRISSLLFVPRALFRLRFHPATPIPPSLSSVLPSPLPPEAPCEPVADGIEAACNGVGAIAHAALLVLRAPRAAPPPRPLRIPPPLRARAAAAPPRACRACGAGTAAKRLAVSAVAPRSSFCISPQGNAAGSSPVRVPLPQAFHTFSTPPLPNSQPTPAGPPSVPLLLPHSSPAPPPYPLPIPHLPPSVHAQAAVAALAATVDTVTSAGYHVIRGPLGALLQPAFLDTHVRGRNGGWGGGGEGEKGKGGG